jgi:hypothetical protein
VFYKGSGNESITITIPAGFVTQGATPVSIYDDVTPATAGGVTCYTPSGLEASAQNQISGSQGGTITVSLPAIADGFTYINVHLDYHWKGVAVGCSKQVAAGPYVNPANNAICSNVTLNDNTGYTFGFNNSVSDTRTIYVLNDFKKDPGIGGLVLKAGTGDPVAGAVVEIYDANNKKLATVSTDEDGWYMWAYKYTGKAASFVVKLLAYGLSQSMSLKSNGYLVVNFTVP